MTGKIYVDPEAGKVLLKKSAVSRRISIRVHPAKGVTVIIPESVPYGDGLRFFLSKRDWVLKTVEKQKLKSAQAKESGKAVPVIADGTVVRTLMSEIVFRFQGASGAVPAESRPVMKASVSTETLEDVKLSGRTYLALERPMFRKTVICPVDAGSGRYDAALRNLLVEILRKEAKVILPAKVDFLASRFGFAYSKISVKHNSSNWGSCSSKGNINLNLNLVRLPEPLCDCVILHELCHLRHPDHGQAFHDLLEKLCTDNICRLASAGGPYIMELVSAINRSRAIRPVSSTLERELKKFVLV